MPYQISKHAALPLLTVQVNGKCLVRADTYRFNYEMRQQLNDANQPIYVIIVPMDLEITLDELIFLSLITIRSTYAAYNHPNLADVLLVSALMSHQHSVDLLGLAPLGGVDIPVFETMTEAEAWVSARTTDLR